MIDAKIFELTIHPANRRSEVILLLLEFGIDDFIEAASDTINADEGDWESVLKDWSERDDAPLLVYKETEAELLAFMKAFQRRFNDELQLTGKWIANRLWQEAWEPDFQFLETRCFFIGSPASGANPYKINIILSEGTVFGSGQHASTQALVKLMEKQARPMSARSFLDVGTGTGVLAFVAHHLGFSPLVATDIEANAIDAARENADRNKVPLELHLGSLPPRPQTWDCIACNILPPTLTELLEPLTALLKPEGELYLAGFHEANRDGLALELKRLGFDIVQEHEEKNWLGWLAKRDSLI